jgi:hypothetical protein
MDRLYLLSALTPKNTPIVTPVSTPWPMEDAHLDRITVIIPDGHAGLTGIRVLWAGTQIIPFSTNVYLTGNDRVVPILFDDYITISGLVIQTYNTDIFDHTFFLEAIISDLPLPVDQPSMNKQNIAILPSIGGTSIDGLNSDFILAVPEDALTVTGSGGIPPPIPVPHPSHKPPIIVVEPNRPVPKIKHSKAHHGSP